MEYLNNKKIAFLTEMDFQGKIPENHPNFRTEFAWMYALNADHSNIHSYNTISNYDVVFVIFPKAITKLNSVGAELIYNGPNKDISIYETPIINILKNNNNKICIIQEGPTWLFNDYDIHTQFNYYNQLSEANYIFAHNEYDVHFYKGLFPQTKINTIPTLMITNDKICPPQTNNIIKDNKVIIGGNFARWYGGFQSYLVANEFDCPIYVPSSHCKRPGEDKVPNLHHLPWVLWSNWMQQLSSFKYAVNLMPTIAAGTFSANCAYFGIPCIGNEKVDTQNVLFPDLSIDINDIFHARQLASQLLNDNDFYDHCSHYSKTKIKNTVYANIDMWLTHMGNILNP